MLALGAAFLLADFGVWNFFGISWWSALLVWFGLGGIAMTKCPDCMAACGMPMKKR
jgi:hypothetical protein